MGLCFICDSKLFGERTRVCSSITPHSNVPYPEKIVELMGEEFVVIVTPADHMCKRCTSLLTHMDKLENDLKLVRNALLAYIQKKYGILPPDQPVKTLDVVNGHLKTDELEPGQKKVPSGLTIRENPPVQHTTLKMLPKPPPPQPEAGGNNATKMKIYKCGFCTFQSKELGHVRFHMRSHMNRKDGDKTPNPAVTKPAVPTPPPQKKRLYRCQVCSTSFDSRINCLDHIQKDHNQPSSASTNANEGKESVEAASSEPKVKSDTHKAVKNDQSNENITDEKQSKNKNIVDTDMLLNNSVSKGEGSVVATAVVSDEAQNSVEADAEKVSDKHDEEEEEAAANSSKVQNAPDDDMPEQTGRETSTQEEMEVDQEADSVEKEESEALASIGDNAENKTGDLDIESMLAAIHNDNPAEDNRESQNII